MTLLDEIKQKAESDPQLAEALQKRQTHIIAELLSASRVKIGSRNIGPGTVLVVLGPVEGVALLDTLETMAQNDRLVYWVMKLLLSRELDVGLSLTREKIDEFVQAGVIKPTSGEALKALAYVPDPVSEYDVRVALLADNGDWRA